MITDPILLGYCFNILSKSLYYYDKLRKEIKPGHRLTDYEIIREIALRCLGNNEGEFQYLWNVCKSQDQIDTAIESSTLGKTLIAYGDIQNEKII